MGLVGEGPEVGEGVEEGVLDALDDVGDHGVSLGRRGAVEAGDGGGGGEAGLGGEGRGGIGERVGGSDGEEVEDEEEEGGGEEEAEELGGEELGLLVPPPCVRHWRERGGRGDLGWVSARFLAGGGGPGGEGFLSVE